MSGAIVYLEDNSNKGRKLDYDLIAVEKGDLLVNMDSQAPNKVVGEGSHTVMLKGDAFDFKIALSARLPVPACFAIASYLVPKNL